LNQEPSIRIALVSDFNAANLAGVLANDPALPRTVGVEFPYGQVRQELQKAAGPAWAPGATAAVVWTQPATTLPVFRRLADGETVSLRAVLREVDEYAALLTAMRRGVSPVFVPTWIWPPFHRNFRLLGVRARTGIGDLLARANLRLAERLGADSRFHLLAAARWVETVGVKAWSPDLWYMAKVPFSNELFKLAVADIKQCLAALRGESRKLVILDLDDTLWGGIVGEDGWQNLRVGGHDPEGEALADFQRALKALSRRGIVLAIVSKNDEAAALEAIRRHPEMVLRESDFAGWRINWEDKAENIRRLAQELNLGLQSAVFIDDSPAERDRVRTALPEVLVPEWPANKLHYAWALESLGCFEAVAVTAEDRRRAQSYVAERRRAGLRERALSAEEWVKGLGVTVTVRPLDDADLPRAIQLLNKTNQMNLATRRLPQPELTDWLAAPNRRMWTFRVTDRFGDYGLTGLLSLEIRATQARIVDFLASCRVLGRGLEEAMLRTAVDEAARHGAREVVAEYVPTARNSACRALLDRLAGADKRETNLFVIAGTGPSRVPAGVTVKTEAR
jgi:FkbH-like protein